MDDLLRWREEFPILSRCVYMISNSLGAMPRGVYEKLKEFADLWATEGVVAWEKWVPLVTETGDVLAEILGAPRGTIILHQNVAALLAIVGSALDFSGGKRKIVYTAGEFPSCHYYWKAQERLGAKVEVVPLAKDGVSADMERLLQAIDERTLIVPTSLVLFRSAAIVDAKAIIEKAHRVGAYVLLDAYQATGTIPLDVTKLGVDFVVGGSVKWLCGGPGAGYLYVRPDLISRLEPAACGWFSHRKPFDFSLDAIDYAPSIWRFVGGSPNVPGLYSARSGYEIIRKIGVEKIRAKSKQQIARLVERAREIGLTVNTPTDPEKRGGTITVDFQGSDAACKELIKRKFIVDYRPKAGIRISPHFYNTDEECDAIMDEIKKIRSGK
ncbi:aminotransferase class V-fold PLP-dependent enzyme [bacterium]|nr:aminotransferase class V-fold PLP-dependent enzyme [bacterium]